jgi:transcriptional regulator of arginine metabolism
VHIAGGAADNIQNGAARKTILHVLRICWDSLEYSCIRDCMDLDSAILQVLEREEVSDQAVLQERLESAGHTPSQSTLSRRLRRLNVRKVDGRYQRVDEEPAAVAARLIPDAQLIEAPPNLIVLRTAPGFAQVLAVRLDRERVQVPGIAGTIAGDDTVFVAVSDVARFGAVREHLARLLDLEP